MSTTTSPVLVDHFFDVLAEAGRVPSSTEEERLIWERQFSLQRLSGYGVELGDVLMFERLRRDGMPWKPAAESLADTLLESAEIRRVPVSAQTRRELQRRASALLRMSQMFDEDDDDRRRTIYSRAADLFAKAHADTPGFSRVVVPTSAGPVVAWWFRAEQDGAPAVAVIGGGEGWAMDWEQSAAALVGRGVSTLLVDGPGQGETRLVHGHHLGPDWLETWGDVAAYLQQETGGAPIGLLGHSMGGAFVTRIASRWPAFTAVCNNGGPQTPLGLRTRSGAWRKLVRFCAELDDDHVEEVWGSVAATAERVTTTAAYLMLSASNDPLVTGEECRQVFDWVPSKDKQLHTFVDADHCLYRFPTDKEHLIADWFADRLVRG